MAQTDEEKEAEARLKAEQKQVAAEAKEDADEHTVAAAAPADGSGTDKKYQIEHGKAPIEPGKEKPVDDEDAAAAKVNRGRGLGG